MEEQELKVLNLIKDKDYAPMKAKEIAMIMHVPKSEYNELLRILGKLEMEMKIQKNRKNQNRAKFPDKFYSTVHSLLLYHQLIAQSFYSDQRHWF